MIEILKKTAVQAGEKILSIYQQQFSVSYKQDGSPLTDADILANTIIISELEKSFPFVPIISEEGEIPPFSQRKKWKDYFLIDPLDGTKEFIKKGGEFTVNIAYMRENKPFLGVVYVPVTGELYWGNGEKSFCNGKEIFVSNTHTPLRVVVSRNHFNKETEEYLATLGPHKAVSRGSSLKICEIASGKADLYPRLGPIMEWDTAAAHAILLSAGGEMYSYTTGKPLCYNKEKLVHEWFITQKKK